MFNFLKNHFRFEITRYFYRFSFKATKHFGNLGFSILILFAKVQRLHGITSLLPNGKHIILGDSEGCTLERLIESLSKVQISHSLSNIYIYSDAEAELSWRFFCYSQVDFDTLNEILLKVKKDGCLDPIFYKYTIRRGKASLRTSIKKNRPPPKLVKVLESYPVPFPEQVQEVFYDTGIVKKGISFSLGDDD